MHAEPTKLRSHLEQSLNNVTGKLTKSYKTFEQSNKKNCSNLLAKHGIHCQYALLNLRCTGGAMVARRSMYIL